jgi:hypothetical protein
MNSFIERIVKQLGVLMQAPAIFIGAALAVGGAVAGGMQWGYGRIVDTKNATITSLKDENLRLRVALGIDKATPSALISLSNAELRAKAATVVARLNEISAEYRNETAAIQKLTNLTDAQRQARQEAMEKDVDQEFTQNLRSDAFNVDFELRRRLGPQGTAGIIGLPTLNGRDGSRMGMLQLTMTASSGSMPLFDLAYLPTLALGITQMAKLLPDNG